MSAVTRTTPYEHLPQYLTVQETAVYLDLTPWTVYQLIHQGKIPHRRVGKSILVPKTFFHADMSQPSTPGEGKAGALAEALP